MEDGDQGDGHAHDHDHDHDVATASALLPAAARRNLRWVGLGVVALAALAVAVLWPRGEAPTLGTIPFRYVDATVLDVRETVCPGVETSGDVPCREVAIRLGSGPESGGAGTFFALETDPTVPELAAGDRIVVRDAFDAPEEFRYGYHDQQRTAALWWLAAVFALAVVAFGRWQGVRALAGLAIGIAVLVVFLVPALVRGGPAVPVALAGGLLIVGVALYLAHGFNAGTTIALLGSLASLVIVTLLASAMLSLARVSGLADDQSQVLSITADAVDLRGLLLAGIVIGVLGSLDDVTIIQVSAVASLRRSAPDLGPVGLYREAIRVGRDHVASSVNTLVLAYAGASLPLLLLFAQGDQPIARVATGEVVAVEIVRMLVGSIGLIAAVPVTTGLAALILGAPDEPVHHGEPADGAGPRWEDFAPE